MRLYLLEDEAVTFGRTESFISPEEALKAYPSLGVFFLDDNARSSMSIGFDVPDSGPILLIRYNSPSSQPGPHSLPSAILLLKAKLNKEHFIAVQVMNQAVSDDVTQVHKFPDTEDGYEQALEHIKKLKAHMKERA